MGTAVATSVDAGPYTVTLESARPTLNPMVLSGPYYIEGMLCTMWFFTVGDNTVNIIQGDQDFSQFDFQTLSEEVISSTLGTYNDLQMSTVNDRQWAATSGTPSSIAGIATGGTRYVGCTLINKNTICEVITFSTPAEFKSVVHSIGFGSAGGNLLGP